MRAVLTSSSPSESDTPTRIKKHCFKLKKGLIAGGQPQANQVSVLEIYNMSSWLELFIRLFLSISIASEWVAIV